MSFDKSAAWSEYPTAPKQAPVMVQRKGKKPRKSPSGISTNDLIFSAHVGSNMAVFPYLLALYVQKGSSVADVTWGSGAFWKGVPREDYRLFCSDLHPKSRRVLRADARALPYGDNSMDCVVFDPPYMHSPGGTAHTTTHAAFEKHYRNNGSGNQTASKYHEAVLDLYRDAGRDTYRVLKERGVFIVKCQDEVCANRQRFTHIEVIQMYEEMGFVAEDLFVIVRNNRPGVSRMVRQVHARKNHSYFLVFWKRGGGNDRWEPPE